MMGSVQRLAVTPRQGRRAATHTGAAPAHETATNEEDTVERDVEGVGAASSAEGAGSAPIDVATREWLQPKPAAYALPDAS